MHRNAIVHELELVCDATYVHQCNLTVVEKVLDALGSTLRELAAAKRDFNDLAILELEHEVREQLVQIAAACMDYLIFSGLSFVSAWEQMAEHQTHQAAQTGPAGPQLTHDDWYLRLKQEHAKAARQWVARAAQSVGDLQTPETFFVTMLKLGANAVAALENFEEPSYMSF